MSTAPSITGWLRVLRLCPVPVPAASAAPPLTRSLTSHKPQVKDRVARQEREAAQIRASGGIPHTSTWGLQDPAHAIAEEGPQEGGDSLGGKGSVAAGQMHLRRHYGVLFCR